MGWSSERSILDWLPHLWLPTLFGIMATLAWAIERIRSRRAQSWPVMDGKVESHSTRAQAFVSERRDIAEVNYSFSINGEYYAGTHGVSSELEFANFPKGSRVVVHYKRSDPSKSFLDRKDVRSRTR